MHILASLTLLGLRFRRAYCRCCKEHRLKEKKRPTRCVGVVKADRILLPEAGFVENRKQRVDMLEVQPHELI